MPLTGYPNGRPGYVVDPIIPLACEGPDTPENMQWQTVEEAKAKEAISHQIPPRGHVWPIAGARWIE
jgi:hypothetical protein